MENKQGLYKKHLERITSAIELGNPDRVPVILAADCFHARQMGVTLADYLEDFEAASRINIAGIAELGEVDGVEYPAPTILGLGVASMSKLKLPGRELPADALWQIEEITPMKLEDYDVVIDKGYSVWSQQILQTELQQSWDDFQKHRSADWPQIYANYVNAGIVPVCQGHTGTPFDRLSNARGMANLLKDMYRIPDKVEAVINIMTSEMQPLIKTVAAQTKPFAYFVGTSRSAPEYMSQKMWERFCFPCIKTIVNTVVESGAYALLHWDNNWDRALEYLKEFPKGKCILTVDGNTDLFKAKEVLGNHMCLMGDIPAAMLTLGTPDEVYKYSCNLVNNLGPKGFILGVGCTVPQNAKVENVKAMIAAATGK
jgi:hypothetical protein